jgi:hypothetical protein
LASSDSPAASPTAPPAATRTSSLVLSASPSLATSTPSSLPPQFVAPQATSPGVNLEFLRAAPFHGTRDVPVLRHVARHGEHIRAIPDTYLNREATHRATQAAARERLGEGFPTAQRSSKSSAALLDGASASTTIAAFHSSALTAGGRKPSDGGSAATSQATTGRWTPIYKL